MANERYPKEVISQIRNSLYLPDLIKKYTSLDKYNRGVCPFHKDSKPSLSISPQKGLWYCFGCGKGGDAFNFIMLAEKIPFLVAVKLLALEAGVEIV